MLGGASDGADYWAHMLLNHTPGADIPKPEQLGRGPRYFRLQAKLAESIAMDDASKETLTVRLPDAAKQLIDEKDAELDKIVEQLASAPPP